MLISSGVLDITGVFNVLSIDPPENVSLFITILFLGFLADPSSISVAGVVVLGSSALWRSWIQSCFFVQKRSCRGFGTPTPPVGGVEAKGFGFFKDIFSVFRDNSRKHSVPLDVEQLVSYEEIVPLGFLWGEILSV